MKKILLLIPLLSIFILASCNDEPYVYSTPTTKTEDTTVPETIVESITSTNTTTTTSSGSISNDGSAPDDGDTWTKLA